MKLLSELVQTLKDKQQEFHKTGNAQELTACIANYQELLNQAPDEPEIIGQLGTAHLQAGQFGAASQYLRRALAYSPANSFLWSNLGCCFRSMHHIQRARDCFMKSVMLDERGEGYSNMASTYINENCPQDGIEYAERAMQLLPDAGSPKWNAALLYLEMQEWDKGFKLFDAGLVSNERPMRWYNNDRTQDVPFWTGTEGQTVAMWDEQGVGDRLLAANLLRNVKGKINVILDIHPRLEGIYKRSFPWIDHVYPTAKEDTITWPKDHKLDAKIPIMSLSRHYWADGNFDRTPYIKPDPELVQKYRDEFKKLGPPPYIGLAWAGGAPKTNTQYRTLKLSWFKMLIESGGTWISMQYHPWAKEKADKFREDNSLPLFHCDAAQEHDYDHTLAALAACDLTVSACNSVIHTCGAAGLPCWVLVPTRRAWRYPSGDYFPWYGDHIKMYHQSTDGDWNEVLKRVKYDLIQWLPKEAA